MSKLTATLWLHNDVCRILLKEVTETGTKVIDVDDTWNNRASAELTVMPITRDIAFIRTGHQPEQIALLNKEFEEFRLTSMKRSNND
jgi:hypothetical protein